jgi:hypothetical protein
MKASGKPHAQTGLPREIKLQCLTNRMLGGLQNCPDDLVNTSYSSQESNHQTVAQPLQDRTNLQTVSSHHTSYSMNPHTVL